MEKYIPYEKLSKRRKRDEDKKQRHNWGGVNPVTRRSKNPRAYDRRKAKRIAEDR